MLQSTSVPLSVCALHPRALALSATLLASLSGCSASMLASQSAEPTACSAEALEISEANQPLEGPSSWRAHCSEDDRLWFCSQMHQKVICTEDPRPKPSITQAAG